MNALTVTLDGWAIVEILFGVLVGAFLAGFVEEWLRQRRERRTLHVDSGDTRELS